MPGGRPKGGSNLSYRTLRKDVNCKKLIQFLQQVALGVDKDGNPVPEPYPIKDRITAATTLLKKTLPDLSAQEIDLNPGEEFNPIRIFIEPEKVAAMHIVKPVDKVD
jgi:hypothetical protein